MLRAAHTDRQTGQLSGARNERAREHPPIIPQPSRRQRHAAARAPAKTFVQSSMSKAAFSSGESDDFATAISKSSWCWGTGAFFA